MEDVKLFIEGFIVGIGKVIPGVSGAMFAMMFGIYEKALNIISNLKTELKKNLKFCIILGISLLLSIVFGSNIIKISLEKFYMQTMFLFLGMMTAGLIPLSKNINKKQLKTKNIILAIVISSLLLVLNCLDFGSNYETINFNFITIIMLLISGFLDAVATVVPGICGTALLMIIGYYESVLYSLSDIFNISNIGKNLFILIPFLIGMALGVIIISKLINYLFKKYKNETYCVIFAFALMSTIIIFIKAISVSFNTITLIISIILFIFGYILVNLLEKLKK